VEPSDSEDMRDAQLEAIFRTQAADLYRYIYRQVHQAVLAEDLTSAVFLKALRWLQQDRSQASVKGWLYATARSLIADYWREHAQLPLLPLLTDASEDHMPSLQARIQHLLDGLPAREREILTLRYLQGYSAAEIGDLFGLSANHVRVLQFRALRRAALLEAQERSVPMASPILPYTEQALRVLELTKEEARALHHTYMGTEHLLLGILREGSAPAAATLIQHGVTVENMRAGISFILGRMAAAQPGATLQTTAEPSAAQPAAQPGVTARTAQVLALAGEEAQRLGEAAISPQHLLVAILREGQGVAAMLLQVSGVRWQQVGETVEISVIPDDEGKPLAVPPDLQEALQQHPAEQRVFEKMSAIKQQHLIDQIDRSAGEAARRQAVERVIALLQQARQNYQRSQQ
jgi:RNA polymerase sigma factor (sigma-70 family)